MATVICWGKDSYFLAGGERVSKRVFDSWHLQRVLFETTWATEKKKNTNIMSFHETLVEVKTRILQFMGDFIIPK